MSIKPATGVSRDQIVSWPSSTVDFRNAQQIFPSRKTKSYLKRKLLGWKTKLGREVALGVRERKCSKNREQGKVPDEELRKFCNSKIQHLRWEYHLARQAPLACKKQQKNFSEPSSTPNGREITISWALHCNKRNPSSHEAGKCTQGIPSRQKCPHSSPGQHIPFKLWKGGGEYDLAIQSVRREKWTIILWQEDTKKKNLQTQSRLKTLILQTRLKENKKTVKTLRKVRMDFPGGPVAKTPCSWCREPGFNPRAGNYPHMPQLRPCTVKFHGVAKSRIRLSNFTFTFHSQISFFFLKKKQKGHKTEKELWNKMANYATEKDSSQFQEN